MIVLEAIAKYASSVMSGESIYATKLGDWMEWLKTKKAQLHGIALEKLVAHMEDL